MMMIMIVLLSDDGDDVTRSVSLKNSLLLTCQKLLGSNSQKSDMISRGKL